MQLTGTSSENTTEYATPAPFKPSFQLHPYQPPNLARLPCITLHALHSVYIGAITAQK